MRRLLLLLLLAGCNAPVSDPKSSWQPVYYWEPYNRGVRDYGRGISLELNPYRTTDAGYLAAWQDGWTDAKDGKPKHFGR